MWAIPSEWKITHSPLNLLILTSGGQSIKNGRTFHQFSEFGEFDLEIEILALRPTFMSKR
jgi:hypothetical protein